jgi:hypothetical protein
MVLRSILRRRPRHAYSWLSDKPGKAYSLSTHPSFPMQGIVEVSGGGALRWVFDVNPDSGDEHVLVVFLTDDEIGAVLDAEPLKEGMLEPIRGRMTNPFGVLYVGEQVGVFRVPTEGGESEFVDELMKAAENPEAYQLAIVRRAMNGDPDYEPLLQIDVPTVDAQAGLFGQRSSEQLAHH